MLKPRKTTPKEHKDLLTTIRNVFGFSPGNVFLYSLAFRHSSASEILKDGVKNSNERLEYLGDAILDAVVADFLFKRFPFKDEGFLTEMRSRMVSRQNLNKLAMKLGFKDMVMAADEFISPNSSIYGDAFEAVLGAIYIDKGYDFTQKLIVEKIINLHMDIEAIEQNDINFKSKLIQYAQKEKLDLEFKVTGETGSGLNHHYIVGVFIDRKLVCSGQDHTIKGAEQHAAERYYLQDGTAHE